MDKARRLVGARTILTMDPAQPRVEALGIEQDRIVAVGSLAEVERALGEGAERCDFADSCVLPGLIEPHTHPDLSAECYSWVDVSGFTHKEVSGVEAALREASASAKAGEWIYAFGLDPMLTRDIGTWGRERLDALVPDNPAAVMIQSMHTLYANSRAMEIVGIDERSPDPPGGGRIGRDKSGRPDGRFAETPALAPFLRFIDRSPETIRSGIAAQYFRYARAGITTIGMPGLFMAVDQLAILEELAGRSDVPIRNIAYVRHFQTEAAERRPGAGDDFFRVQGVKLWYDGSPYSGTMLLDEPYLESRLCCCTLGIAAGETGHANFEVDELLTTLAKLRDEGWQVLTHAQGDRGTREILDLYEQSLGDTAGGDHRWRLEHCALIAEDQLKRAKRLGVSPSFHMNHIHYYGDELRDSIVGPERAERLMPVNTALAQGHRVSLHADSPMYPPEPWKLVQSAVSRRTRSGRVLAAHEAIPLEAALRAITIDAAWQLFADERIGSLEAGKLADLTVVDRDPFEVSPERLDEIEVQATWLGGRLVDR